MDRIGFEWELLINDSIMSLETALEYDDVMLAYELMGTASICEGEAG